MAKGEYIGVSGKAKKVKKMYVGIGGKAKKVKKAYIGVGGKAKLFWSGAEGTFLVSFGTISTGDRKYAIIDRSNLTITINELTSRGLQQIAYCKGRWFASYYRYSYDTIIYLAYSTDGITWTEITDFGYQSSGNMRLCADDEYVYVMRSDANGMRLDAINATTLSITYIYNPSTYYNLGAPFVAYDNKILIGVSYYSNATYRNTRTITRDGSTFISSVLSTTIGISSVSPYGSSQEKTITSSTNASDLNTYLSYYKNGTITITQTKYVYATQYHSGSGVVYGNKVFTDGLQTSSDGTTWNGNQVGQLGMAVVGYGDGVFIRIGAGDSNSKIKLYYSENGTTWTELGQIETGSGTAFSNRYLFCVYNTAKGYGDK